MIPFDLNSISIVEEDRLYRIKLSASFKDEEITQFDFDTASIEIEILLPIDTKNIEEIKKRAIAKAEIFLNRALEV